MLNSKTIKSDLQVAVLKFYLIEFDDDDKELQHVSKQNMINHKALIEAATIFLIDAFDFDSVKTDADFALASATLIQRISAALLVLTS